MGHIILDHNFFSCCGPSGKSWMQYPSGEGGEDPLSLSDGRKIAGNPVLSDADVFSVARSINDGIEWNKAYVPVVMAGLDQKVSSVAFYHKDFFRKEIPLVRDELMAQAVSTGSFMLFPVLPESFGRGYRDRPESLLPCMEGLMRHDVVVDCAYWSDGRPRAVSWGYDGKEVPLGRSYLDAFGKMLRDEGRVRVDSTFALRDVVREGNLVTLVGEALSFREKALSGREAFLSERERVVGMRRKSCDSFEEGFLRWAEKSGHKGDLMVSGMMRGLSGSQKDKVFSSLASLSSSARDKQGRERPRKDFEVNVNMNVNERQRGRGR